MPEAVALLAGAIHELAENHQSHAILCRIDQLEKNIMSKLDDLIVAATALSTASDAASLNIDNLTNKVDTLITHIDTALAALENADLPPAGEAAINTLRASRDAAAGASEKAAAAGDKVDAEVLKVDASLPTPAPAAPPVS